MSGGWNRYRLGGVALQVLVGAVVVFLIAPLAVVMVMSFGDSALLRFPPPSFSLRWYHALLESDGWRRAAVNSLIVGSLTAVLATAAAVAMSLGLVRRQFRGRSILYGLILSPLMLPVIVLAVSLYSVFAFLRLNGTLIGLVIGHTTLAFPYAVLVLMSSLEKMDMRLQKVAMTLGASPVRAFFRVTLPLLRPAVMVALLFSFLVSFDEVTIALFVTGPLTATLPKMLWDGITYELTPMVTAVSTLLIISSALFLFAAEALRRYVSTGRV